MHMRNLHILYNMKGKVIKKYKITSNVNNNFNLLSRHHSHNGFLIVHRLLSYLFFGEKRAFHERRKNLLEFGVLVTPTIERTAHMKFETVSSYVIFSLN